MTLVIKGSIVATVILISSLFKGTGVQAIAREDSGADPGACYPIDVDVPVTDNPGSTGALNPLDSVWGGSYMDESGYMVIWLTENQKKVFEQNPDLLENETLFKKADYSLEYLTELMANISRAMGDGEFSFVTTAALREERNRVEVTITAEDADEAIKIQAFDTVGGGTANIKNIR